MPSVFSFSTSVEKRVLSERRTGKRKQLSEVNKLCSPCSSREHISEVPVEPTDLSSNSDTILSSQFSESFDEDAEEDLSTENAPAKFLLVDWQKLKNLFEHCLTCGEVFKISQVTKKGTLICIEIKCQYHSTKWSLQLMKERIAEGNMLLSAGVLLSGLMYEPVNRMMKISDTQFLGKSAFYEI